MKTIWCGDVKNINQTRSERMELLKRYFDNPLFLSYHNVDGKSHWETMSEKHPEGSWDDTMEMVSKEIGFTFIDAGGTDFGMLFDSEKERLKFFLKY